MKDMFVHNVEMSLKEKSIDAVDIIHQKGKSIALFSAQENIGINTSGTKKENLILKNSVSSAKMNLLLAEDILFRFVALKAAVAKRTGELFLKKGMREDRQKLFVLHAIMNILQIHMYGLCKNTARIVAIEENQCVGIEQPIQRGFFWRNKRADGAAIGTKQWSVMPLLVRYANQLIKQSSWFTILTEKERLVRKTMISKTFKLFASPAISLMRMATQQPSGLMGNYTFVSVISNAW